MPNWCKGSLKIRGAKEDVKRFLLEGLEVVDYFGVTREEAQFTENEYEITLTAPGNRSFYVTGTRRFFIDSSIEWQLDRNVLCVEFKSAWGIDKDGLSEISRIYNLDFNIYGFERGMEFNEAFEVHKGNVIKYETIKFDDYEWECIFPNMGG